MAGPFLFVLGFLLIASTVAAVAMVQRARGLRARWAGWQALAASRGLEAAEGDPLAVAGTLGGGPGTRGAVIRTLSGTVDGIPVAVVVTVAMSGTTPAALHARSDLFGLARVGAPVPIDRIRSALAHEPDVAVAAADDFAVLMPRRRRVRLAVDLPPPDEAARLVDLAARAGRAARS